MDATACSRADDGALHVITLTQAFTFPMSTPFLFRAFLNAVSVRHLRHLALTQYMWSVSAPFRRISVMGLAEVQAQYLPLVNLGFDLVLGGPWALLHSLAGIAAGYAVDFIKRAPTIRRRDGRDNLTQFVAREITPSLATPHVLRLLFDRRRRPPVSQTLRTSPKNSRSTQTTARTSRSTPSREAILAATEARLRRPTE